MLDSKLRFKATILSKEFIFRNLYRESIEFFKVTVAVTSAGFSAEFPITDSGKSNLILNGKESKKFICQFDAPREKDSSEIQIGAISLFFGNEKLCHVLLRFPAVGREMNLLERLYPEIQQLR